VRGGRLEEDWVTKSPVRLKLYRVLLPTELTLISDGFQLHSVLVKYASLSF